MKTRREDIPLFMDALGATVRVLPDFGTAVGTLAAEHYVFDAGVDLAPLLQGLEGDLCQAPHWGYVLRGHLSVDYADGTRESCRGGDVIHWPAGHTVRAEEDSEVLLFSSQVTHQEVLHHVGERLATLPA